MPSERVSCRSRRSPLRRAPGNTGPTSHPEWLQPNRLGRPAPVSLRADFVPGSPQARAVGSYVGRRRNRPMDQVTGRTVAVLVVLAAIWGASFELIEGADRQLAPLSLVWLRLTLAAAVSSRRRSPSPDVARWPRRGPRPRLSIVGTVNSLAPFALLAWAETRIDSGLAAILPAAAPIFSAVVSTRVGDDRVTVGRLVGVAVLVGAPFRGGHLVAFAGHPGRALLWAGGVYAGRRPRTTEPLVVAAGSLASAAVLAAPFGSRATAHGAAEQGCRPGALRSRRSATCRNDRSARSGSRPGP